MLNSKNRVFNPYFSIGTHPIRLDSFYSIGIMLVGLSCSTADMVYHATTWYPGWSLEEVDTAWSGLRMRVHI